MFKRFLMFCTLALAAGCGASTDEEGKLYSDRVWFDQAGVAHCPHPDCMRTIALRPTDEETDRSIVLPFKGACENGNHPVRWAADDVICWSCNGAGTCGLCRGTGLSGKDRACPGCVDAEGKPSSTGECGACDGLGTIRHGATMARELELGRREPPVLTR